MKSHTHKTIIFFLVLLALYSLLSIYWHESRLENLEQNPVQIGGVTQVAYSPNFYPECIENKTIEKYIFFEEQSCSKNCVSQSWCIDNVYRYYERHGLLDYKNIDYPREDKYDYCGSQENCTKFCKPEIEKKASVEYYNETICTKEILVRVIKN